MAFMPYLFVDAIDQLQISLIKRVWLWTMETGSNVLIDNPHPRDQHFQRSVGRQYFARLGQTKEKISNPFYRIINMLVVALLGEYWCVGLCNGGCIIIPFLPSPTYSRASPWPWQSSEATNLGAAPTLLKQEYPHYQAPSLVILQWIPFVQPVINLVGIEISDSEEIVETATVTSALLRGKLVKARQKIFLKIYDWFMCSLALKNNDVCVVSLSFAATRINGNCVADIRSVVVLFTTIVALCCTMLFYLFASRSRPLNLTVSHLGPWLKKFFNSRCQRLTVNQPFPCQFLTMLRYQCKRHKKRFAGATAFLLSSILHLLLFFLTQRTWDGDNKMKINVYFNDTRNRARIWEEHTLLDFSFQDALLNIWLVRTRWLLVHI